MQEYQKSFIKRHIKGLLISGSDPKEAISNGFSILGSNREVEVAIKIYEKTGSLARALVETKVISIEDKLLDAIAQKENKQEKGFIGDVASSLLDTEKTIDDILSLLRIKLRLGLSYAAWLSLFSTTVFTILSRKAIPQFKDMFDNFGAELPSLTKVAIDWQNSFLPPGAVGFIIMLIIGFLLFTTKDLSNNKNNLNRLKNIPFLKQINDYINSIRWLGYMELLTEMGYGRKDAEEVLSSSPERTHGYLPNVDESLTTAEKIGCIQAELKHQKYQLIQLAEKIVSGIIRKILGIVMFTVVGYIVFAIMASYLPIFQTGAII